MKLKRKTFKKYSGKVHDITVKNSHSYNIEGLGVHNSAAGSLICYLNGITTLDPIKHGLMFERFINPDRVEMPDIDTDFQSTDRAREMLREMFGEDNVASITSYGTFQIKGLLKDVGRVLDIDHREITLANKDIQKELKVLLHKGEDKSSIDIKLSDVENVSKTYNGLCEKYPSMKEHVRMLYGKNRHLGRHACGVVIGDNLPSEMPVFYNKGALQTSYTMGIVNKNVEEMGFIKFDLLGLSTLNIIDHALKLISKKCDITYEEAQVLVDPDHMDLNDQKVLKTVFHDGNFTGIFQFTSNGIRKMAMRVGPDNFEDVSAVGALYRPGPLGSGMDKLYADRKHGLEEIVHIHPILEDVLSETYGCLVYQEQLLNIGLLLGKMKMKDVNRLRKIFLKKDKSKGDDFRKKEIAYLSGEFSKGCVENGLKKKDAEELWDMFEHFGGYGFNAAHAKSYGLITMQTAWLRTYHPLEFYCAVLTHGKADELQSYVDDIKRQGFKVLPVNMNKSSTVHVIEGDAIRLAFNSVTGVGGKAAEKMVKFQPYTNFRDFLYRTGGAKTASVPLIKVGAFEDLDSNIAILEERYKLWVENPKLKLKKNREEFENRFFDIKDIPAHSIQKLVEYENELLGFSLIGSPFELLDRSRKIDELLADNNSMMDYKEFLDSNRLQACIPLVVKDWNERAQRNGNMFAFMKFADKHGNEFEAPCFGNIWRWVKGVTAKSNVYLVTLNRKEANSNDLVVGKPGFAHTQYSSYGYMLNVDDV